jgi:hypothetical protein
MVKTMFYKLLMGTVQGSILGPVYAMFVSPLFNLEELFAFADNILVAKEGSVKQVLINDLMQLK